MTQKLRDYGDSLRRDEELAKLNGRVIDVGYGKFLTTRSGLAPDQLHLLFPMEHVGKMVPGSAGKFTIALPPAGAPLVCYVYRRKFSAEIGTREDLDDVGWGFIADMVDAAEREGK